MFKGPQNRPEAQTVLASLTLLAGLLAACGPNASHSDRTLAESIRHVTVAADPDRFKYGTASGGVWNWGDEILVLYLDCGLDTTHGEVTVEFPCVVEQARSADGGGTWEVEAPRASNGNAIPHEEQSPPTLEVPIDFAHPDFALAALGGAPSLSDYFFYLYYSYDRGRHWIGPYAEPDVVLSGGAEPEFIGLEPDFIVDGERDMMAFGYYDAPPYSADSVSVLNPGRPFFVRTTDGGLSWSPASPTASTVNASARPGVYFGIEPSSVRLSGTKLLSLSRWIRRDPDKARSEEGQDEWIEAWTSEDNGTTWSLSSRIVDGRGMRPNVIQLPDRSLIVTYEHRAEPYGIRARLSRSEGSEWSDPFTLRSDGFDDALGYTVNALRTDGSVVTIYYFNRSQAGPVTIEATIWDPRLVFDY